MKETFLLIYGKELRWLMGLQRKHRIYVIYAILSAILMLTVWSENVWIELAMSVNLLNALRLVRHINGNGLEE